MELTLLTTVDSSIEAGLIVNNLRNFGIETHLFNENFSNLMPQLFGIMGSGIQIMVAKDDIDRAREMIDMNDSKIHCPDCKSEDVIINIEKRKSRFSLIMMLLFLGGPAGNLMTNYTCNKCGFEFKK